MYNLILLNLKTGAVFSIDESINGIDGRIGNIKYILLYCYILGGIESDSFRIIFHQESVLLDENVLMHRLVEAVDFGSDANHGRTAFNECVATDRKIAHGT